MKAEEVEKLAQERIARVNHGAAILKRNTVLLDLVEHVSESFLGFHTKTKTGYMVTRDIDALREEGLKLIHECSYMVESALCVKFLIGDSGIAIFFYVSNPHDEWQNV